MVRFPPGVANGGRAAGYSSASTSDDPRQIGIWPADFHSDQLGYVSRYAGAEIGDLVVISFPAQVVSVERWRVKLATLSLAARISLVGELPANGSKGLESRVTSKRDHAAWGRLLPRAVQIIEIRLHESKGSRAWKCQDTAYTCAGM